MLLFFAENWYKTKHLQQQLEKEKSAAELAFLRSQINPHFLFNTINDIYSLTYQKSEQAPDALLKLSKILRYMLREGTEQQMPLKQEIDYLENVIELQRISSKGLTHVHFDIKGSINDQQIASLLFISFVENAFKHGVLTDPANPVRIQLTAGPGTIAFSVSNKKNNYQKDATGGIGLANVRRRLDLIYPHKHQLSITDEPERYTINLKLGL